MPALRDREVNILNELADMPETNGTEWARPMDVGGTDASHHSGTLAKLVRMGYVERTERAGYTRKSYLYRITETGRAVLSVWRGRAM